MKILFVSSGLSFQFGGSAVSEASLCRELQKQHDVEILTPVGRLEKDFVSEYNLKNVQEFSPLQRWSREFPTVDICHLNGHWKWPYFFIARQCQRRDIPYIIHPRGMFLVGHRSVFKKRAFNSILGKTLVRNASGVIALSEFEKERQFSPYKIPEEKIRVIPNGIPVPSQIFESIDSPAGVKKHFLYIGRLEARKNLLFLIDAFKKYVEAGGTSDLLLVGPVERGYDREVENQIRLTGMKGKVFVLAPAYGEQKTALLREATAVIYPTLDEPFGRVPFEAIAHGVLPIIPSESGSAEYIRPLLPHSIYTHQDVTSLARIMRLTDSDLYGLQREALPRAKEWVRHELNWEKIVEKVVAFYDAILLKRPIASAVDRNLSTGRLGKSATH